MQELFKFKRVSTKMALVYNGSNYFNVDWGPDGAPNQDWGDTSGRNINQYFTDCAGNIIVNAWEFNKLAESVERELKRIEGKVIVLGSSVVSSLADKMTKLEARVEGLSADSNLADKVTELGAKVEKLTRAMSAETHAVEKKHLAEVHETGASTATRQAEQQLHDAQTQLQKKEEHLSKIKSQFPDVELTSLIDAVSKLLTNAEELEASLEEERRRDDEVRDPVMQAIWNASANALAEVRRLESEAISVFRADLAEMRKEVNRFSPIKAEVGEMRTTMESFFQGLKGDGEAMRQACEELASTEAALEKKQALLEQVTRECPSADVGFLQDTVQDAQEQVQRLRENMETARKAHNESEVAILKGDMLSMKGDLVSIKPHIRQHFDVQSTNGGSAAPRPRCRSKYACGLISLLVGSLDIFLQGFKPSADFRAAVDAIDKHNPSELAALLLEGKAKSEALDGIVSIRRRSRVERYCLHRGGAQPLCRRHRLLQEHRRGLQKNAGAPPAFLLFLR